VRRYGDQWRAPKGRRIDWLFIIAIVTIAIIVAALFAHPQWWASPSDVHVAAPSTPRR